MALDDFLSVAASIRIPTRLGRLAKVPGAGADQVRLIGAGIEVGVELAAIDFGARAIGQVDDVAIVAGDLAAVVVVLVRVDWDAGLHVALADIGLALIADLGKIVACVAGGTKCLVLDVVDV